MNRVLSKAIVIFIAAVSISSHAYSACEGRFEKPNEIRLDGYDPYLPIDSITPASIDIQNNGTHSCQYRVYLVRAPKTGGPGAGIAFAFNNLSGLPILSQSDVALEAAHYLASAPIEPSVNGQVHFTVVIQRGQYFHPREFYYSVTAILTPLDDIRELDRMLLRVRVAVKSVLDLSVSGGGLETEVDFGELVAGQSRTLVLRAFSNEDYVLSVESENGGFLQNAHKPEGQAAQWSIPYRLHVDGTPTALDKGSHFITGGSGSLRGSHHNLTFTILDVSQKRAGLYLDTVTFSIKPDL